MNTVFIVALAISVACSIAAPIAKKSQYALRPLLYNILFVSLTYLASILVAALFFVDAPFDPTPLGGFDVEAGNWALVIATLLNIIFFSIGWLRPGFAITKPTGACEMACLTVRFKRHADKKKKWHPLYCENDFKYVHFELDYNGCPVSIAIIIRYDPRTIGWVSSFFARLSSDGTVDFRNTDWFRETEKIMKDAWDKCNKALVDCDLPVNKEKLPVRVKKMVFEKEQKLKRQAAERALIECFNDIARERLSNFYPVILIGFEYAKAMASSENKSLAITEEKAESTGTGEVVTA
jgi:hypothetical protein